MKNSSISDYALIGDTESAALVSRTGSIDWLCWPDFSSPACLAALLGNAANGRWLICPTGAFRSRRRYRPHGLILETTFTSRSGTVRVTDFMPIRGRNSDVVRIVRGLSGKVGMTMQLVLRFDFGRTIPWLQQERSRSYTATAGPGTAYLRTPAALRLEKGDMLAEFEVKRGQTIPFVLTHASSFEGAPRPVNPELAFKQTERFWAKWSARNRYRGQWSAQVERSLITLKALTYRPTGGIIAAPTTSLPEKRGGNLNWDYRYCWLRDATFTLLALLNAGYVEEAMAWEEWLLRAVAGDAAQTQIMYGLRGERQISETKIPWLTGYQKSSPVRLGNAASLQFQLDIFGELADAFYQSLRAGLHGPARGIELQQNLIAHLRQVWQLPDQGIWEERGKPQQFVYSKVMAWVAVDRTIHSAELHALTPNPERMKQWIALRQEMHDQICSKGYNRKLNSFTVSYGSQSVDASLLLLPLVGFLPGNDPRVLGTIKRIERELMTGGLLKRNRPRNKSERQGAFLACSFWLVQARALAGRKEDAERLFRKLLRLQNDVGLFSEEYSTRTRQLVGNFPQALSHIALVNAAFSLGAPAQHRHMHG
ncbi:MAG TPA: glycoside hydrolase family 15 protein [Acidobacteriaceae bacterium]|nr:glycoside hydrolase family 15 protein [Acidobacteriaceae bacterium]